MHEQHLFEYAVIRIVPRVEREEFINTGVILYCSKHAYLQVKIYLDQNKLNQLSKDLDLASLQKNLLAIQRISNADPDAGPIARLELAERFRWLTATRSTVIQTSRVHPGLCTDPEATLQNLFETIVL